MASPVTLENELSCAADLPVTIMRTVQVASATDDEVVFSIPESGNCSGCHMTCGAPRASDSSSVKYTMSTRYLKLEEAVVEAGDSLDLQIRSGSLISLSLLVYLLPMLLMLLFAVASDRFLSAADSITAISATLGLLTGFVIAKTVIKSYKTGHLPNLVSVRPTDRKGRVAG